MADCTVTPAYAQPKRKAPVAIRGREPAATSISSNPAAPAPQVTATPALQLRSLTHPSASLPMVTPAMAAAAVKDAASREKPWSVTKPGIKRLSVDVPIMRKAKNTKA